MLHWTRIFVLIVNLNRHTAVRSMITTLGMNVRLQTFTGVMLLTLNQSVSGRDKPFNDA